MTPAASVSNPLSRRDFVNLLPTGAAAMLLPAWFLPPADRSSSPTGLLPPAALPHHIRAILALRTPLALNSSGYLTRSIQVRDQLMPARVPLAPTRWNLEHRRPYDRLRSDHPWGLVLHWDGAPTGNLRTVEQLVRGLNESVHFVSGETMTNSAHFGVGAAPITVAGGSAATPLGVAQLQHPWYDGTPLIASHLNPRAGKPDSRRDTPHECLQVMAALGIDSILRSMYEGVWIEPNTRTLAVEISGSRFDTDFPAGLPPTQTLANLLSLLSAIMHAYPLGPWHIVGHQEVQYDKPDPGKLFMGLVRYLLGVSALVEGDPLLRRRVFGVAGPKPDLANAALTYFQDLTEYVRRLVLEPDFSRWLSYCDIPTLLSHIGKVSASRYQVKQIMVTAAD